MKEEDFEAFLKDFCDFLNGLEESVARMKQQIAKLVGVAEQQKTVQEKIEKLKQSLGDLAEYLSFTVRDGKAVLMPRQFLGAENFAKIARIAREHGGEYISAGKESRFEIPL